MLFELRSLIKGCEGASPNAVETPWISQLIPRTFFCELSCEMRTSLFTKIGQSQDEATQGTGYEGTS